MVLKTLVFNRASSFLHHLRNQEALLDKIYFIPVCRPECKNTLQRHNHTMAFQNKITGSHQSYPSNSLKLPLLKSSPDCSVLSRSTCQVCFLQVGLYQVTSYPLKSSCHRLVLLKSVLPSYRALDQRSSNWLSLIEQKTNISITIDHNRYAPQGS